MQVVVTIEEEEGVSPPRVSPPRYVHQAVRISALFGKGSKKRENSFYFSFNPPKLGFFFVKKKIFFLVFQEGM